MTTRAGKMRHDQFPAWITRHPMEPAHAEPIDPLDHDRIDDDLSTVSRRGLVRLALVASETGARFQRDGTGADPLNWLMTPRTLFAGRVALDACTERASCLRAVVLHGLGMDLDAKTEEVDELIGPDCDDDSAGSDRFATTETERDNGRRIMRNAPRLFTATLVYNDSAGIVQAFDAAVLRSRREMRERISRRLGAEIARAADIVEGFSPSCPLVDAFMTDGMADMLRQVAAAPGSPLAAGLEIVLQQRFAH